MRARGPKPCSDVLEIMQNTCRDKTQEVIIMFEGKNRGFKIHEQNNRSMVETIEILSDTMHKGLSEYEIESRVAVSRGFEGH